MHSRVWSVVEELSITHQGLGGVTVYFTSSAALPLYSSHQDVALLNLANVLHQSHHSKDALIVLRIALSVSPTSSTIHLTTGNVLAVSDNITLYSHALQHISIASL